MLFAAAALGTGPSSSPAEFALLVRGKLVTERDCRQADGRLVLFSGRVAGRDGVAEPHRLVLDGNAANGRQWQAQLPRDAWGRCRVGDMITVRGVLRLHEVNGERYAVVRGAAK